MDSHDKIRTELPPFPPFMKLFLGTRSRLTDFYDRVETTVCLRKEEEIEFGEINRKGIIGGGEVFENCALTFARGVVINFHRKASSFALPPGLAGLSALVARFSHCFSRVRRDGKPPREGEGVGVGVGVGVGEGVKVSTAHRSLRIERTAWKGEPRCSRFFPYARAWIRDFFLIME